MDTEELVAATETLDADEIAELAPDLPQEVMDDVFSSLPVEEREQLRAAMSFEDDMVGALMDFEDVQVRPDVTLEVVLRYLRRFDELPSQTDQLFVVDRDEKLLGVLPVNKLIVTDPDTLVGDVMQPPVVKLQQHEKADEAARAFERYDLVSAPVVDTNDKLVGRVTVDEILDFVRERGEEEVLAQAGLREEEDVFASVWKSFHNRWAWLAINLVTAFIASRVIGAVRGLDREARRARGADADRRRHRRQFRQPDDHDDRARGGAGPGDARARAQLIRKEIIVEPRQRRRLGRRDGARRDAALQGRRARARDGARDDAEPDARGADGRADPDDDAEASAATRRSARRC